MFLKLSWKLATSEKRASSPLVTDSNAEIEVNSLMEVQNHSEPTITLQPTTLVSVVEAVVKRFIPASNSRLTYLRELEEANI